MNNIPLPKCSNNINHKLVVINFYIDIYSQMWLSKHYNNNYGIKDIYCCLLDMFNIKEFVIKAWNFKNIVVKLVNKK